jgi:hypothetical protein
MTHESEQRGGVGTADQAREGRPPREDQLFSADRVQELRTRWDSVQAGFVDEPRRAVAEADRLVDEVVKGFTDVFTREREKLERQWDRGENLSTDESPSSATGRSSTACCRSEPGPGQGSRGLVFSSPR